MVAQAYSSPHLRRVASALVTKGNFIVLSVDLTLDDDADAVSKNLAEIQV